MSVISPPPQAPPLVQQSTALAFHALSVTGECRTHDRETDRFGADFGTNLEALCRIQIEDEKKLFHSQLGGPLGSFGVLLGLLAYQSKLWGPLRVACLSKQTRHLSTRDFRIQLEDEQNMISQPTWGLSGYQSKLVMCPPAASESSLTTSNA